MLLSDAGEPPAPALSAACPLCHAPHHATTADVAGGGNWRCTRCGQSWSANRLANLAAYGRYAESRLVAEACAHS